MNCSNQCVRRARCADCSHILLQVGMATNIPPHNLGEVVDALITLIHNPNATVRFSICVAISFFHA